jgi:hypothetical protein
MRRPHVRGSLDRVIDRARFQLDTFPRLAYQPLPQVGRRGGVRECGVHSRWQVIAALLDEVEPATGLDIGSQVGFFTLAMARRGTPTTAVEMEPRNYRTLLHVRDRLGLADVGVLVLRLTPATTSLLPSADAVLFMSVWHHLVRWHGEPGARAVLRALWARTGRVLVFETGENEMPARYRLPDMGRQPQAWIDAMLRAECPNGTVRFLGLHPAADPDGRPCRRHLFGVLRVGG